VLWLCIELPALQLETVARGVADSRAALVMVEGNRVVYRNAIAAECGITAGSTLATATSLCPGLRFFARNPALEQARLRLLATAAYRFSDRVSLHESAHRPAALLLEASGSLRLFGGLYALKRQVTAAVTELGHTLTLGVGHTPLAALALARAGVPLDLPASPAAETIRATCTKILRGIQLAHTELDADLVRRLEDMGIRRLGQLLRLPTTSLGRRFGTTLLDYLGRLSGQQPDPRLTFVPPPGFDVTLPLTDSISNREVLLFPMQRLLKDLEHWLVGRQLGVVRLRWSFATVQRDTLAFEVELSESAQRHDALLAISRLKLEAGAVPAEIVAISLTACVLSAWSSEQRAAHSSLFVGTERPGRKASSPLALVDRFRARLGHDVCHGIAVADDVRPERAWKATPPALAASPEHPAHRSTRRSVSRSVSRSASPSVARPGNRTATAARPLWLLTVPLPVTARQLTLLHGPERIDSGWWDAGETRSGVVCRDYYVARHTNGTTCWVFKESGDRWYVHGCFA
jgi:protein ImuB